jgi:hypothetical protein
MSTTIEAPAAAQEKLHYRGRYIIRMARKGDAFVYDISTRSNGSVLLATGIDMLSLNEAEALDGIAQRFCIGSSRE